MVGYRTVVDVDKSKIDGSILAQRERQVEDWECVENCPVRKMGEPARFFPNFDYVLERMDVPFDYVGKAARKEKEAGLLGIIPCAKCGGLDTLTHKNVKGEDEKCIRCSHPTVKPIALIKWLATLLLPPPAYAPRRILIPFSGVMSEGIGAMLAGWEFIQAIEQSREYVEIGGARMRHWFGVLREVLGG